MTQELISTYTGLGYSYTVAEALAENEIQPEAAELMSVEEVFGKMLEWEGILGFDNIILRGLESIQRVKRKPVVQTVYVQLDRGRHGGAIYADLDEAAMYGPNDAVDGVTALIKVTLAEDGSVAAERVV